MPITASVFVVVTALSLMPLPELPPVPGGDKSHHLIAYAVLVLPVVLRKPRRYFWVILMILLWGGVIELIQPYVNRYGEWYDFGANSAGVIVGWVLGNWVLRFLQTNHFQNP